MAVFHILQGFSQFVPRSHGGYVHRLPHPLIHVPGVYCVMINESGKIYIGSTINLLGRMSGHISKLRHNQHPQSKLQAAYNEDPEIQVWYCVTESINDAVNLEQYLVDCFKDTTCLCNIGVVDVTKPQLGVPVTIEHRQKISDALSGKKRSLEARQQHSKARFAFELTDRGREIRQMQSKTITVNGVNYPSITEASRRLGIRRGTLVSKYL